MFFINSEQRSRNAVAEQAIGSFQDSLRSPILRQKIGASLGSLAAISDRMYVPNIKHGLVLPPKKNKHADGIAVIAAHPSDRLYVAEHYSKQSERQHAGMERQLAEAGLSTDDARSHAREINLVSNVFHGPTPTRLDLDAENNANAMGETWTTQCKLTHLDRSVYTRVRPEVVAWFRRGRPLIALRYSSPGEHVPSSLMMHEAVHVEQVESNPLGEKYDRRDWASRTADTLKSELPAYRIGALGAETLLDTGLARDELHVVDRTHLAFDEVRQRICSPDDPFDSARLHTQALADGISQLRVS